jgi:hypothetical protein
MRPGILALAAAVAMTPAAMAQDAAHCSRLKPLPAAIGPRLVPFDVSPFPYAGENPVEHKPFLDYNQDGRRGHISPRGGVHFETEAYNSRNTLLYLPKGFDLNRPALIVVFFHGNNAELMRDVAQRQDVPRQLALSGLNAALVAPQFALDIPDSSAGRFWQPDIFRQYLAEAARHLAELRGEPCAEAAFARLGVVLVAYSGGYNPAAYALDVGGADDRIRGVVLLDALYGETDKFDKWIDRRQSAFFFSAYSDSSRAENTALRSLVSDRHIEISRAKPLRLRSGRVIFLDAGKDIDHNDFVTHAWVEEPLRAILSAIPGFRVAAKVRESQPARK